MAATPPRRRCRPPPPRIEPTPTRCSPCSTAPRRSRAGRWTPATIRSAPCWSAPDHATVLMEQGNVDSVNHAEAVLAREAARRFAPAELWPCTLVTTVEPCAMCAGTQYWANIGRVVFGIEEKALLSLTGDHPENPTLDLPCRHVFARGQKDVKVIGPVAGAAEAITALHRRYWRSM